MITQWMEESIRIRRHARRRESDQLAQAGSGRLNWNACRDPFIHISVCAYVRLQQVTGGCADLDRLVSARKCELNAQVNWNSAADVHILDGGVKSICRRHQVVRIHGNVAQGECPALICSYASHETSNRVSDLDGSTRNHRARWVHHLALNRSCRAG